MKASRVADFGWVGAVCGLLGSLGAAAGLGCGGDYGPADNPTTVRDVTGVVFGWQCGASGCQVALAPETPPPDPCGDGERAAYSYAWGRFFDLCSVCVLAEGKYWSTSPGQCRILACDTSADCPIIYAYAPTDVYECVNGLCQNADQKRRPRTALRRTEAEQLCFAVHDRTETSNPFLAGVTQVEAELDTACTGSNPTDTCSLPAACRAP